MKHHPRDEDIQKNLLTRLHKIQGQLAGVESMIEKGRYCGDILVQVAAIQSALSSFGTILFHDHLHSCVVEDIQAGHLETLDEVVDLMKRLR